MKSLVQISIVISGFDMANQEKAGEHKVNVCKIDPLMKETNINK